MISLLIAGSGLNISAIDRKRVEENNFSSFDFAPISLFEYQVDSPIIMSEKDLFYSYSVDLSKRFVHEIHTKFKRNLISVNVAKKAIEVISSLSPSNLAFLDLSNIYITDNKTVVMDFFYNEMDYFSLEIGKEDVGFFSEKDGEIIDYCESVNLEEDINLNNVITRFQSVVAS